MSDVVWPTKFPTGQVESYKDCVPILDAQCLPGLQSTNNKFVLNWNGTVKPGESDVKILFNGVTVYVPEKIARVSPMICKFMDECSEGEVMQMNVKRYTTAELSKVLDYMKKVSTLLAEDLKEVFDENIVIAKVKEEHKDDKWLTTEQLLDTYSKRTIDDLSSGVEGLAIKSAEFLPAESTSSTTERSEEKSCTNPVKAEWKPSPKRPDPKITEQFKAWCLDFFDPKGKDVDFLFESVNLASYLELRFYVRLGCEKIFLRGLKACDLEEMAKNIGLSVSDCWSPEELASEKFKKSSTFVKLFTS